MSKKTNIISFKNKREESIEEKKRAFERIVFHNFMGTYSVVDDNGSCYQIEMVDISHDGCQFQVPWNKNNEKHFDEDKELVLRMYFTENSYLPIVVNIRHAHEYIDRTGTYMRYGCKFDKATSSIEALHSFVEFIDRFAEHSVIDKGDAKVYFL